MHTILRSIALYVAAYVVFTGETAHAQTFYTTSPVQITQLQQPYNNHLSIFVSPAPPANCTNAQPFVLQEPNVISGGYPGYISVAPYVMAAFLYNKTVTIRYACSGGFPQVTTIWVNQ